MSYGRFQDKGYAPGSVGDIHRLIRSGRSTSRSGLARSTNLAPSTVSSRVETLIRLGLVRELGAADAHSGRRARTLAVDATAGFVAVAILGAHHCQLALSDLGGKVIARADTGDDDFPTFFLDDGPEVAADALWYGIAGLAERNALPLDRFLGGAIGIPAPIEYPSGRVATPSFMSSWHGADLPAAFSNLTNRPVLIENDANLIVLRERNGSGGGNDQLLAVKIGTRIGSGILVSGMLYRGVSGAAGELAHTAVPGKSEAPCACPVENCLESVAGGGALVRRLNREGVDVQSTADVLMLGRQKQPAVLTALREAGAQIGRVIASVANVLNPSTVVLAGSLAASPILVAAVRAQVYQCCLPIIAERLDVRTVKHALNTEVNGAIALILDEVLAPARINASARDAAGAEGEPRSNSENLEAE